VITPIAVQTASWCGSTLASPLLTKATLARLAPAMPITPHSSHAGKKAPNRSNDGAPLAEQPAGMDARHRRAILDRVREHAVIFEGKDARVMTLAILIEFRISIP
jgi:hypothetical protein